MKVAVTSSGKSLDSAVDPRFGRAAYFLIVDTDSLDFEVVDNADNINAFKGAGIQAAALRVGFFAGIEAGQVEIRYDSGEYETVFLRPVMASPSDTTLNVDFVLQPV